MSRDRTRIIRFAVVAVAALGSPSVALPTSGAGASVRNQAAGATCPLAALDEGRRPGRDHVLARAAPGERGDAPEAHRPVQLVAGQGEGHARQPDRRTRRRSRSTSPGSATGDLPDLVADRGQRHPADDRHAVDAPRAVVHQGRQVRPLRPPRARARLLHGDKTLWPMPFNVSNPVLYYDKNAFRAAGLDPEQAADDARRGEGRRPEDRGRAASRRRATG